MTTAHGRIAPLDFIRGVAVMGILLANLPAFGLPEAAYFSPRAWGGTSPAELAAWFVNFVLVEGRMRGLFSFLFGASMLLVIDRAGDRAARVHFARMAILFAIGCAHLYLVWSGDILAHYALVGGVAFLFVQLPTRALLWAASTTLALTFIWSGLGTLAAFAAGPDAPGFASGFGVPPASHIAAEISAIRGSFADGVGWRWRTASTPLVFLKAVGLETLSAMLFGMAAYRSGFLAGTWKRARYRRWATVCIGLSLAGYAVLGANTLVQHFDQRWVFFASIFASAPFRVLGFVGYAALLMLLFRPGGWWSERIAAAGRAAFTNYLGTSLAMALIFNGYGLALFGRLSRAELYWLGPLAWAAMLAWSQPWLRRYRHGPLEWLWRSLARRHMEPLRR